MAPVVAYRYYVYIVTNEERNLLETGVAGDLSIRLQELKYAFYFDRGESPPVAGSCIGLLYWEAFTDADQALFREREIRKFSARKKWDMVSAGNPRHRFLNEDIIGLDG